MLSLESGDITLKSITLSSYRGQGICLEQVLLVIQDGLYRFRTMLNPALALYLIRSAVTSVWELYRNCNPSLPTGSRRKINTAVDFPFFYYHYYSQRCNQNVIMQLPRPVQFPPETSPFCRRFIHGLASALWPEPFESREHSTALEGSG